ncbi:Betaine-aldehyde dehydrogenase family protein [Aphelenchoides bicaudatus]|nr:Betaine-aldehyde dehydrogenase family protein [Aphelenchoides bicaudatus]
MSPASIGPEAFDDDLNLHYKFGYHVVAIYYASSLVIVFVDLIPIVIGLFFFMYPELHRQLAIYPQFLQYYDRVFSYHYYIAYNSTIFAFILLHFVHIISIGLSIAGVRYSKPYLMLTQLIFLVFRIGLFLLLLLMFSIRLLPLPCASVGDIIFFRRLKQSVGFEAAVLDVSTVDSDVFHVGMVINETEIVHALPNLGVSIQSLQTAVKELKPDIIELGKIDIDVERKQKAARYATRQVGAEYNDLFLSDCLNSRNKHSFYCCQLIVCAYKSASLIGKSPFLDHKLNFKGREGQISDFWVDYYQQRGIHTVPQDQPGSHPSKLRASPVVSLAAFRYCSTDMEKLKVPSNFLKSLHYVGGAFSSLGSSKNSFKVYEPRSGDVLTEINSATKNDVEQAVSLAKTAQQKWAATPWLERSATLHNVGRLIRLNVDLLAEWETRDNGKPINESIADVLSCADTFEYFSGVDLSGQYLPYNGNGGQNYAYTSREPLGVVGCIGAWNYPIQTCTWKVAPAVACGNSIIYKPSPLAPITSVLLAQLMKNAGVPDNVVTILQGNAETGTAICRSPDISKVSFTGSIQTGKLISQNASTDNVKPVTLELGGKSACIVFDDADIEVATNGALMANFYSQGQVCSNASKVLVHKSIVGQFTDLFVEKVKNMRIGDPFDKKTHVGASISKEHVEKVLSFIDDAKKDGATILRGGEQVKVDGLENGYYLSPCVLANVNKKFSSLYRSMRFLVQVALIIPFESDEEALQLANETEFGLAAGVFTTNLQKASVYSNRLIAGNVYVNTFNDTSPFVPFGGFKQSGYGRENGKAAVEHYSQIKSVFVNASNKLDNPFQ